MKMLLALYTKNIPLPSMESSVKAVITVQNSAQPTQSTYFK